jgi:hypothetical protein
VRKDRDLLPPIPVIADRLTRNQRERNLLRALFRLAVRASQDAMRPQGDVKSRAVRTIEREGGSQ